LLLTFLSQGRPNLIRPSSSHLTSASSSFVLTTVPNPPVGFPKSPRPMTRSPGFNSGSGAGGWSSRGSLAWSESGIPPRRDSGGCGALRSFGVSLLIRFMFRYPKGLRVPFLLVRKSIGLKSMASLIQSAHFCDSRSGIIAAIEANRGEQR
jgi:hypothetical protein